MKNYCGIKGMLPPPMWMMHNASCKIHDDNYDIGGDWIDRLKYDHGFLRAMLRDCMRYPLCKRVFGIITAYIYYFFVRSFGWIFYNKR